MNILFKEGSFVEENCERGRFRSPRRETLLRGRLVQNEGGLDTMLYEMRNACIFVYRYDIVCVLIVYYSSFFCYKYVNWSKWIYAHLSIYKSTKGTSYK